MLDRRILLAGITALLVALLGPGSAIASVKCQCNNGSVTEAMGADPDDDDVEDSCNDACSESGGGTVWSPESDGGEDDDASVDRGVRHPMPRR